MIYVNDVIEYLLDQLGLFHLLRKDITSKVIFFGPIYSFLYFRKQNQYEIAKEHHLQLAIVMVYTLEHINLSVNIPLNISIYL